jgi:L-aspartate oxidase
VEFVQFHPTALHHPAMPRPLLSEALRGHGALLRDANGERFVDELLPRDKVSRAITGRMLEQGVEHLWLDATGLERFGERFPTIAAALAEIGLDPAREWLPISPAAHYFCGGIVADHDGASSMPGLWAAGETACNGVMGANRLASNSLLDGMVFAPRAVEAIEQGKSGPDATGAMRAVLQHEPSPLIPGRPIAVPEAQPAPPSGADTAQSRDALQRAMTEHAGVLRSATSLEAADRAACQALADASGEGAAAHELLNLATVARAVIAAATVREETRGAHTRTEFPAPDDAFRVRLVL